MDCAMTDHDTATCGTQASRFALGCGERWYVATTSPHKERVAEANLAKQNYRSFLPIHLETRRHARKFKTVLAPVFPSYIFVVLDVGRQRWRSVNGTLGVQRLITDGERPLAVAPGVVETLIQSSDRRGALTLQGRRSCDWRSRQARGRSVRRVSGRPAALGRRRLAFRFCFICSAASSRRPSRGAWWRRRGSRGCDAGFGYLIRDGPMRPIHPDGGSVVGRRDPPSARSWKRRDHAAHFSPADEDNRERAKSRPDHWRDRPGRRLSRRVPARERLRRPRRQAPILELQHRAHRASLRGSARPRSALRASLRRHDRRDQPDPNCPGDAARRDLQSRGAVPRPGFVRDGRIHGERRRHRHASPSRGDTPAEAGRENAASTRRRRRSFTARFKPLPRTRPRPSIRALRMRRPSSTPTGSRSIIARPTPSTLRTAFCSTTRARFAARPSSRARSPAPSPRSISASRTGSISAISTPSATGAMRAIMCAACG